MEIWINRTINHGKGIKIMRKTKEQNRIAREILKIELEKNQERVKEITITVEWVKSRTWGHNPHATAEVTFKGDETAENYPNFERREGYKASGCGYDKESTVIAGIFDDFLKYKLWGTLPQEKKYHVNGEKRAEPYGIVWGHTGDYEYRYYSGGIGTNCYYTISEYIGGKFEHVASGKGFDVYRYTDNEG